MTTELSIVRTAREAVFGTATEVENGTIFPVTRIAGLGGMYDFGRYGSGEGGMVRARPVGLYAVNKHGTRWIPATSRRNWRIVVMATLSAAALAGFLGYRYGRTRTDHGPVSSGSATAARTGDESDVSSVSSIDR
jgi:hypothetical protein